MMQFIFLPSEGDASQSMTSPVPELSWTWTSKLNIKADWQASDDHVELIHVIMLSYSDSSDLNKRPIKKSDCSVWN